MQSTTLSMQQPHNQLVNNEEMPSSNQREELRQAGLLVACFVLPAEQAEKLISMLQDIARNPANEAPLNLVQPASTSVTQPSSWLTHFEAAAYLGVAVSTLYRYAEQERIECRKIGNRLEYRRASLDRFKESLIRLARRARTRGIIAPTLDSGN
jgi:excisionase family DNA binding protein